MIAAEAEVGGEAEAVAAVETSQVPPVIKRPKTPENARKRIRDLEQTIIAVTNAPERWAEGVSRGEGTLANERTVRRRGLAPPPSQMVLGFIFLSMAAVCSPSALVCMLRGVMSLGLSDSWPFAKYNLTGLWACWVV